MRGRLTSSHDLLRRRGDLGDGEYDEELAEPLLAERRAVHVRVGSERRLIAAEDAGRYRDALGAMPPGGLPEVFLEASEEPLHSLVRRYARTRGPFTTAGGERPLRPRRRARSARPRARGTSSCAASCGRAGRSASGAIPRCCAGCGAPRWRLCGRRSSRPSRRRSAASCRAGTGSTAGRPCARRSCRFRAWRCRSRSGSRMSYRAACPATGPSSSTSSAPRARSSGSVRGSTASPSTSARTRLRSGRRRPPIAPSARCTSACARRSRGARSSGTTCSRTPGSRPRRRCRRSGISSGRAR